MKALILLLFMSMLLVFGCSKQNSPFEPDMGVTNQETVENTSLSKKSLIKVFRSAQTITIDGLETEWVDVPKNTMRKYIDVTSPIDGRKDLSGYFRILWDDDNLYVFAKILDSEINVNGAELYERDGIEIYLDGDNSKTVASGPPSVFPPPAYDGNDDFIRFIPYEANPFGTWGIYDVSNYEFAFLRTSKGWNFELKMPFSDLPAFQAQAGHVFGLEVQVNDNDQDQRQNFLKWYSVIDDSWFNPSLFGTAVLFKAVAE